MKKAVWSTALACWLLVGVAHAQVGLGEKATLPEAKSLANTKLKSLKSLRGHLVLYEYFAHW